MYESHKARSKPRGMAAYQQTFVDGRHTAKIRFDYAVRQGAGRNKDRPLWSAHGAVGEKAQQSQRRQPRLACDTENCLRDSG